MESSAKLQKIKENFNASIITNSFKKFITLYTDRISINIQTRINYYIALFKIFSAINKNQCITFFNGTDDEKQYTIGDNKEILLTKKIGSESKEGIIYFGKININHKRLYKFAIKIMKNTETNFKELILLNTLSKIVINNKNPHFPILYKHFICDNPISSSIYPKLIQKDKYLIILTELANSDLSKFLRTNDDLLDDELVKNTMQQIFISILSFHIYIKAIHTDAHWGNFLYHKIKPGGYIHYKIFNEDVYIKNMGYLWIIWDYQIENINITNNFNDYYNIISVFENSELTQKVITYVYSDEIKAITEFIKKVLLLSIDDKKLWKNYLFKNNLFKDFLVKPEDSEIINLENPYILNY
jgi:hypothetical protein